MQAMVYLDHQSTTPCDPRVVAAMLPWFGETFANAHSVEHAPGRAAEAGVAASRADVAALIGAEAREIVFTSGATEANNLAIKGAALFAAGHGDGGRRRVITLATEHECVLGSVESLGESGFEPVILPVEPDGRLDPALLAAALAVPTLLVSIMAVNNEIGVIQDLPALAAIAKQGGALVHCDAAQAAGRISIDLAGAHRGIDLLSLSAHKLYGPKGVGALFVRRRPRARLLPLLSGGGQERGLRPGTLPTPLIAGFGEACRIARAEMQAETTRLRELRDELLARLTDGIPGLRLNGSLAHRIAANLNLTFPAAPARALMDALPWLALSTGSACSSADLAPSHVLRALGLTDAAIGRSLRLALGRTTSLADVALAASALIQTHASLAALA